MGEYTVQHYITMKREPLNRLYPFGCLFEVLLAYSGTTKNVKYALGLLFDKNGAVKPH